MATRRTLSQTRDLLLDTGADVLRASGMNVSLGALNLMDVCRAAGLKTAGSAYKIWETQDEYRVDLLRHLVHSTSHASELLTAVMPVLEDRDALPSITELIRIFASGHFAAHTTSDSVRLLSVMWLASPHDAQLASSLATESKASRDRLAKMYEVVASTYDHVFVPPFDAAMLASALDALLIGMQIAADFYPDEIGREIERPTGDGDLEETWNLYACAAEAIIKSMIRPRASESTSLTET